jgi:hypothetical protein
MLINEPGLPPELIWPNEIPPAVPPVDEGKETELQSELLNVVSDRTTWAFRCTEKPTQSMNATGKKQSSQLKNPIFVFNDFFVPVFDSPSRMNLIGPNAFKSCKQ